MLTIPAEQCSPHGSGGSAADELLDIDATCKFFGGTRPISKATLYRGIKANVYPAPVAVGANSRRWLRSECQRALMARIAERDASVTEAA